MVTVPATLAVGFRLRFISCICPSNDCDDVLVHPDRKDPTPIRANTRKSGPHALKREPGQIAEIMDLTPLSIAPAFAAIEASLCEGITPRESTATEDEDGDPLREGPPSWNFLKTSNTVRVQNCESVTFLVP